jgi:hypothetical protein
MFWGVVYIYHVINRFRIMYSVKLIELHIPTLIVIIASGLYAIAYHREFFTYFYTLMGIFVLFFTNFLPYSYRFYIENNSFYITYYLYVAIFLLPPVYDLYNYYNNKQLQVTRPKQIPSLTQSAGSSRKKHK